MITKINIKIEYPSEYYSSHIENAINNIFGYTIEKDSIEFGTCKLYVYLSKKDVNKKLTQINKLLTPINGYAFIYE